MIWPRTPERLRLSLAAAWGGIGILGGVTSLPLRDGLDRILFLLFAAAWVYGCLLLRRHLVRSPRVLGEVIRIPTDQILDNPFRIRVVPDPESVEGLARSIETYGIITPIVVRARGDKYELVTGQRRLLAARRLGRDWIPAVVRPYSDKEMLEVSLLENVQRAPLTQVEEARAFARLSREFETVSERDLTTGLGLDPVWVGHRERLLGLPEVVQQAVILGTVTSEHAQVLADVADPQLQIEFLKKACEQRWDPQELARQIAGHQSAPAGEKTKETTSS